jgi:hypothetical protein
MVGALGFPCGTRTSRWSHVAWGATLRGEPRCVGSHVAWLRRGENSLKGIPRCLGWASRIGGMALAVCVPWVSHTLGLALRHGRSARFPPRCGMRTSRRGHVAWLGLGENSLRGVPRGLGSSQARGRSCSGTPQARERLFFFEEAIKDCCLKMCLCVPHVGSLGSRYPAGVGSQIAAARSSP